MASEWKKGPVCGVENCRSQFYEEGDDGYHYCQRGHRQGNVLITGQDDDDFNPYLKRQRKKSNEESEKVFQYYKGHQAFDLYLKCYQLVLRHQIWFLIQSKGLPAELESVIFDLWALRITNLQDRVGQSGDESQSQMFSTTSESATQSEEEASSKKRQGRRSKDTPKLIDTLALCYLGIVALRLPITPGDLHEWITNDKMVYLRAIKCIPEPMREHLPANYHATLDPNGILEHKRLYMAIVDLATMYQRDHGISFPALNDRLLLFRYLKELALPLEIWPAATDIAKLLGYSFSLTSDLAGKRRIHLKDIPEAQLIAVVVVAVKLIYPFDDMRRYPRTAAEPAAAAIDWDKWNESLQTYRESLSNSWKPQDLMNLTEKDVFSMSGDRLDQYLDWYQETWVDETIKEHDKDSDFRRALFDEFPISPRSEPREERLDQSNATRTTASMSGLNRIRAVHSTMKTRRVTSDGEADGQVGRPGSGYKRFRHVEDIPERAKPFFQEAARISGLSLKMLVKVVFSTERAIEVWDQQQRKQATQNSE